MTNVSDMQSLLGSLKDSPYFPLFADKALAWEKKFITLDESLLLLSQIQRKWVYLEPIFGKGALPAEEVCGASPGGWGTGKTEEFCCCCCCCCCCC